LFAFTFRHFVIAYRHLIPYDIWCYDKHKQHPNGGCNRQPETTSKNRIVNLE